MDGMGDHIYMGIEGMRFKGGGYMGYRESWCEG